MRRQRWQDLSTAQRAGLVGAVTVQLTLLAAALADVLRRPADEINGDRRIWLGVSFINFVGPVAYFLAGRKRN